MLFIAKATTSMLCIGRQNNIQWSTRVLKPINKCWFDFQQPLKLHVKHTNSDKLVHLSNRKTLAVIYIYIYIYLEREREREIRVYISLSIYIYLSIYLSLSLYIYIYIGLVSSEIELTSGETCMLYKHNFIRWLRSDCPVICWNYTNT